ncbi:MAG: tRNA (adenosine(37)-N6)-dimethylallyltransferase MiaA [Deferribacterota bacterium]|nr:tRNA (adenosine(37)-N6)-dimethylallyltransferase MiaA [Deferribacterota bacterium]
MLIPIITGPTGVGKSKLSEYLSEIYSIEIVSADAFQVYRFMDIGTSKPPRDVLNKVRHHLINILNPDELYSAGRFVEECEKILESIIIRGKLPLIVGGTAMYIERLVSGIFGDMGTESSEIRKSLEKQADMEGYYALYERLKKIDNNYALKIHPNDKVRIIRALEVYEKYKKPYSRLLSAKHKKPKFNYKIFLLRKERDIMYEMANRRVDLMFEKGWIKEVENLLNIGYNKSLHSFRAIGYLDIANYLEGVISLEEVKNIIKRKTRQFIKRQLTYFKHMKNLDAVSDRGAIEEYFKNNYRQYRL